MQAKNHERRTSFNRAQSGVEPDANQYLRTLRYTKFLLQVALRPYLIWDGMDFNESDRILIEFRNEKTWRPLQIIIKPCIETGGIKSPAPHYAAAIDAFHEIAKIVSSDIQGMDVDGNGCMYFANPKTLRNFIKAMILETISGTNIKILDFGKDFNANIEQDTSLSVHERALERAAIAREHLSNPKNNPDKMLDNMLPYLLSRAYAGQDDLHQQWLSTNHNYNVCLPIHLAQYEMICAAEAGDDCTRLRDYDPLLRLN